MIQLSTEERDAIFEELRTNFNNDRCIDCGKSTKWASVYLGLFLCIDCAGKHREYGVKYSFVRSLTLDGWNQKQILYMQLGGNSKFKEYWQNQGSSDYIDYKSQHSQKYKEELTQQVEQALSKLNPQLGVQAVKQNPVPVQQQVAKPVVEKKEEKEIKNTLIGANVEVVQQKSGQNQVGGNKKQAKKIEVDFENLQFDDPFGLNKPAEKQIVKQQEPESTYKAPEPSTFKQPQINQAETISAQQKLEQMKAKPVKAISSATFSQQQDDAQSKTKIQAFQGQQAISSKDYFGENEEVQESPDKFEQVRSFFFSAKDTVSQMKDQAGGYFKNLSNKWNGQ